MKLLNKGEVPFGPSNPFHPANPQSPWNPNHPSRRQNTETSVPPTQPEEPDQFRDGILLGALVLISILAIAVIVDTLARKKNGS
ncbi:hypothetical protein A3B18_00200 [Candidatus Giovannonibacteria bacterium RIFCSPLOWO2_01_FULL_46_13]|uniref:Uncharacterized protein n=1 Tax=Candidatus Giovannonibacteria bacterium RIFCSPLOWO2_01_FULL_46_13 TaxID=1798352 RepID=A0A1F5X457_9BACT|nr:MAG: hypothetical protein A3B18_00200 [Candidatus Giovannonibacteria bacterium RIFCSPLOWO2_01_FULL_46_13]